MESREEGAEGIIKLDSEMAVDKGEEMEENVQEVDGDNIVESETDDEDVAPDLKCSSDLSEINNIDKKRVNEEGIGEQIKSDQQAVEHCDQDEDQHDVSLVFGCRSLVLVEELRTEGQVVDKSKKEEKEVVDDLENEEVKENNKELAREDEAICGFETDALELLAVGSSESGEHQNRIFTKEHSVMSKQGWECTIPEPLCSIYLVNQTRK